jgi:co-chaperonin GroES (HSP10)
MKKGKKELFVVGDRVLIVPDVGEDRSSSGLYLPKWAVEKESIQAGRIVELGPGIPMPSPNDVEDEPWREQNFSRDESDMQAQIGDYAIFLRKAAVEVKFDNELFLLVPHPALLLLVRDND